MNNFFTNLKDKAILVISAIAGILGLLFLYERSKRQSNEALVQNQESKEQIREIEAKKDINNAGLILEEERRNDINKNLEEKKNEKATTDELIDFINRKR